jgi:mono/diheme cytochrome c family protein
MNHIPNKELSSTATFFLSLIVAALLAACSEPETTTSTSGQNEQAPDTPGGLDFAFYREAVEPVFLRPRGGFVGSDTACIACHTGQATAPLKLEPPMTDGEEVYWNESQSLSNFGSSGKFVGRNSPPWAEIPLKAS